MPKHIDAMLHMMKHSRISLCSALNVFLLACGRRGFHCGFILTLFLFAGSTTVSGQNCTANAGGAQVICGSSATLKGSVGGSTGTGGATWTFISGPDTPVIDNPSSLETNVSGMTKDGRYTFQLSYPCAQGTSTSTVVITAHPRPATFTAGSDVINSCATVGSAPLSGVIPQGFSGAWRTVNIFSLNRFGTTVSTNSSLDNPTSATPTLSLINKSNHEIDPAYYAILKITSTDGLCSYEDTTVVRFAPNPQINVPITVSRCMPNGGEAYFDLRSPPYFSTAITGSAGTTQNGVSIVLNVVSQPAGANIAFNRLETARVYVSGMSVTGTYIFTLTVNTACGSFTTPQITYNFQGFSPHQVNFQPPGHTAPEQLVNYAASGSGGEAHCGVANTGTPESFYFSIDPSDPPNTITTVASSGIVPGGVAPAVVVTGSGTMNRVAVVTPPAGGWQIGTYRFTVTTRNSDGGCGITQNYYIHVSDGNRPDVAVSNAVICREGNNPASVAIQLPAIYKGVVNASYFQDFIGYYNFRILSKPQGAADPSFQTSNLRTLTSSSTVISNFTSPGDYTFEIRPYNGAGVGPFIEQEYACSGKSIVGTFSVHVEDKVNSNAGADQSSTCPGRISLQGDDAGTGTGTWTLVSAPSGSVPVIVAKNSPSSQVSGINNPGVYVFRWTIVSASGFCSSVDETSYTVTNKPTLGAITQPTCGNPAGQIQLINLPPGNWTISRTGSSSATITGSGSSYTDSGLIPGTYAYTVTSESGCTSDPSDPSAIVAAISCTPPVANPVHFVLTSKPVVDQILVLNGVTTNPPAPNGQDKEDGLLGGSILTSTLVVTALPDNGVLFYNGTPVTVGQVIPDFDASRLTLKLTGSGYSSTTFHYAFIDQSGLESPPAPYTIEWQSPLPVTLVDFRLRNEGRIVLLDWMTSMEKNSDYFEVQHSSNSVRWTTVHRIKSRGESVIVAKYTALHESPVSGINYYRLKMVDKGNSFEYGPVRSIQISGLSNTLSIYPNPATEIIMIKSATGGKINSVEIYNLIGVKMKDIKSLSDEGIDISWFPAGMYLISATSDSGLILRAKFSVQR